MTLRQKQSAFARAIGQLITHVYAQGYELTMADGSIDPERKYRVKGGPIQRGTDAVHMAGGLHYQRLAQDLNLWIGGQWITDGGHPAWAKLGAFWKTLHPDARWGGDFQSVDSNHFSLAHGGKQ